MKKLHLFITLLGCLFLSPLVAQTADGETPAEESVCDDLTGPGFGLCNAYCEAMDCDLDENRNASQKACDKVEAKYKKFSANEPPPCIDNCPDVANPGQEDSDGDGLGDACDPPQCGNAVVEMGHGITEACDNGVNNGTDCNADCTLPTCGDGFLSLGEECDMGPANDDTVQDACRTDCKFAYCGDGVTDTNEACDDNNTLNEDSCTNACEVNVCGDGIPGGVGEACDDGNAENDDACLASCQAAVCGDGIVQTGVEACDDGNDVETDGCNTSCELTTYSIGDTGPGGGIVFHVTDGGLHGLEAARDDQTNAQWCSSNIDIADVDNILAFATPAPDSHSGAHNTPLIAAVCGPASAAGVAAAYTWPNGQTDGFLPNKEELNLLFIQRNVVGGFANDSYWSSSESVAFAAWLQGFGDGGQNIDDKSFTLRVRAVRAF